MATSKQTEKFSELLNKFLEDSKEHFEEELSVLEVRLEKRKKTSNAASTSSADANDDPIICKNIKKGNKVELVCKPASKW